MAESEFNWMIGSAIKVTVSDITAKQWTRPTENISSLFSIKHKLNISPVFNEDINAHIRLGLNKNQNKPNMMVDTIKEKYLC